MNKRADKKTVSSPSAVIGDPNLIKKADEVPNKNTWGRQHIKAFTLIELLVVVLIIGILAAIALPQYQKAVEKSKAAEAITLLKSVHQAVQEYQLANGTFPNSFADLTITPPWSGKEKWYTGNGPKDVLSNDAWSMILYNYNGTTGLNIGRLSGKYKGGVFYIWYKYPFSTSLPLYTLLCAEKIPDIETPGDFCQKVMQSGSLIFTGSEMRYYNLF